ncbi:DNA polymerase III subunit delta' [Sphingomonas sp.]|jgi:DNA polymerase-3 subunit delta'|uniref:DNA polymerase III subunit delta' n=1 Tax=Sphingomonas sp. TaxID=28214 RepID=UPI002E2F62A3|nr:DNA polymerase III subunit delta' [Sphingomonas sp.]HEX4693762.1 DNA polymerase III subunit delta' [Sphingomonas sp.]
MTSLYGNALARQAFSAALEGGSLHHAWLFAGPEGVGKASFAMRAARRILAGAGQPDDFSIRENDRTQHLIDAGSHPDFKKLERLPKDEKKPDQGLARSITVAQVRALEHFLGVKPTYSDRRVVVIDSADDLERNGANALLKNLEEPPAGTVFLLVSHAPGRLLPTIRSRCRLLRFEALDDADMRAALTDAGAAASEIDELVRVGQGSPAQALAMAGLDIGGLDKALTTLAEGDPTNAVRAQLASSLALKAAQPRYEAFLDRAPRFIADHARTRSGEALRSALDAYDAARNLAASALGLSLDAQGTVFEMGGIVASLANRR